MGYEVRWKLGRSKTMARDKRPLSVRMALEWAFMTECAQLHLDDLQERQGFGIEWVIIKRLELEVGRIEGGGTSDPHPDAEIIASTLTELAAKHKLAGHALRVAEYARAGKTPDWMPGAQPKIEPAEWRGGNQFGRYGKSEVIRRGVEEYTVSDPSSPNGRAKRREKWTDHWTPCVWNPSLQEIESARDAYIEWVTTLKWVRIRLLQMDDLETIEITDRLPPEAPWKAK